MAGMRVTVLGDGGWGTALALLLLRHGNQVSLWGAFEDYLAEMGKTRENRRYLPGVKLPPELSLVSDPAQAVVDSGWIVIAVPSQHLRGVLARFPPRAIGQRRIVCAMKGLELKTLSRPSQVIQEMTQASRVAVLAGPNVAHEVVRGDPTLAVAAAGQLELADEVRDLFMTETVRIYVSTDLIGVELGGILKNVMAIASGISDGLGFGPNAKAALITRALVEMTRFGQALGGHRETFFGLSGLGDLITTAFNPKSRNRRAGEALAQGKTVAEVEQLIQATIEGIPTTQAIHRLAQAKGIEMPIVNEVYRVIYERKSPLQAVHDLMTRPPEVE